MTSSDGASILMVLSMILCVLSAVSGWFLVAGTALALIAAAFLLINKQATERRKSATDLARNLSELQSQLIRQSETIMAGHRKRQITFDDAVAEFNVECEHYRAEGASLESVLVAQRGMQKNQYLAKHLVHDNIAAIQGLTAPMASMLQSFGIDSALDIDKLNLSAIPNMSSSLKIELLRWRTQVEAAFVHKPDHGVSFSDAKGANDAAIRRFKASQARRVLMGAKRLTALVDTGRYELQRSLAEFDQLAARGHDAAIKLRDFQTHRRPLERRLNRSWGMILACAVSGPLLGLLSRLLFG